MNHSSPQTGTQAGPRSRATSGLTDAGASPKLTAADAGAVPVAVPASEEVRRAERAQAANGPRGRMVSVGLVMGGIICLQFGSSVAVLLFPRAGALGVVTLRLVVAALVLLVACRPKLRGYSRGDWATVLAYGVALAGMNSLFYQAIDRIPLGAAVTLEFLGPLILSIVTSRRALSLVWATLALGGVALLGRQGFDSLNLVGAGCALAAGGLWAAYILLAARAGQRFPAADGLALAMTVAAVLSLPLGIASAGTALLDPVTIGLGAAVAMMSSVAPYTLELLALRKLPASGFAVMMSLEPAAAATAGFLVLHQSLGWAEIAAIAMVVLASVGAVRSASSGH